MAKYTTYGLPGIYNATPITLVDGQGAALGLTEDGYVIVQNPDGSNVGGGVQYTEGDTDASITGTAIMWEDAGDTLRAVSAAKPLPVSATIDTTGLATSANQVTIIGHIDGIEGLLTTIDADTGNMDTSLNNIETAIQIMDDWDNAASDGASVSGDVAHDSSDAGEPVKVGGIAYSPDGTTPGTAVAELDRTNFKADLDGRHYVNTMHARWWTYHEDSSSALTDASVQADPGDGFQIVITSIIFSNGSTTALNMFLEEGSTKIFGPHYLEAINGRGFVWRGFKPVTPSTAVTITTSAAVAHGIDITGFIQAV